VPDTRIAVGGIRAITVRSWFALFPGALLLVILQESTAGFPDPLLVAVSTLTQHVVSGIIGVSLVAFLEGVTLLRPNVLIAVAGAVVGICRGVTAGVVYSALVGGDPQWAPRIAFWVIACAAWLPLFASMSLQTSRRRALLRDNLVARRLRDRAAISAAQTGASLRIRIVSEVRDAIAPAIAEIRQNLSRLEPRLDSRSFSEIGRRLGQVADDAAAIVTNGERDDTVSLSDPPRLPSRLGALLRFERDRPFFASALTGALLAALIVPNALIADGADDVIEAVFVVAVMTIGLYVAAVSVAAYGRSRHSGRRQFTMVVVGYCTAGVLGAITVIGANPRGLDPYDWVLAIVVVPATVLSALALSTAVSLGSVNDRLERDTALMVNEVHVLSVAAEQREREIRESLTALLHGPVQGRLAACVMALTFHAQETGAPDPERTAFITDAVLEHLALASQEIDALITTPVDLSTLESRL
jgi:hypothetical protein